MKVLVVDDEPDVANLVKTGIAYQRPDYEIVESHSCADALKRAASEAWDLVILDLTMPELDGFTVLGALRGGGSDVPIIVLTARDTEQDRSAVSSSARMTTSRTGKPELILTARGVGYQFPTV